MGRGKYLILNTAILGVIILCAVMIYVGVGAVGSIKALAIAVLLAAIGLILIGTLADFAMRKPRPSGWIQCDREWVEKHGRAACETSPRILSRTPGRHYHPAA